MGLLEGHVGLAASLVAGARAAPQGSAPEQATLSQPCTTLCLLPMSPWASPSPWPSPSPWASIPPGPLGLPPTHGRLWPGHGHLPPVQALDLSCCSLAVLRLQPLGLLARHWDEQEDPTPAQKPLCLHCTALMGMVTYTQMDAPHGAPCPSCTMPFALLAPGLPMATEPLCLLGGAGPPCLSSACAARLPPAPGGGLSQGAQGRDAGGKGKDQ